MFGFDPLSKEWQELRVCSCGSAIIEQGSAGFWDGKQFRAFLDFTLLNAQTAVIKFVSPIDFVIRTQGFFIVEGECLFEAVLGGVEGGSFSVDVPTFGKNRSSKRPIPNYERQITLKTGGTITGGSVSEVVRIKTSDNSHQAVTVGNENSNIRFLPAGTYYLRFTATGTVRGVYTLEWEEKP